MRCFYLLLYCQVAGGLAGSSYGAVSGFSFSGRVTGDYQVGGLLGVSGWGSSVDGCSVDASVPGVTDVGTFAGTAHNDHQLAGVDVIYSGATSDVQSVSRAELDILK